ncbi:L-histidine N(alpha)-methyltransferase [Cryobacterium sp. M15]|uniref:L-histidine N(alpha)-methyltransferase n=1 Tax=Cryobacterium sp. M15 TaxID=2048291 RepID=UPI0021008F14|nr:L-histidine N(alpha)-methyltransferase [Cryobacterium sp. M15]
MQFHEGEELRTEISAKFRLDGVVEEMETAGFSVAGQWTDPQNRFALTLAAAI